jgi:predicted DNA-binding transcriptional regulator YafY
MRFEKADNLLRLAMELQARRQGMTIEDIQTHLGISRSTALRMKGALEGTFLLEEAPAQDDRRKRWRIAPGTLDRLAGCTADELADLEMAVVLLRRENRREEADRLEGLGRKLKAVMKPDQARKVQPDLEALLEAEGLAMRAGPRPRISHDVVESLREAMKACRQAEIRYRRPDGSATNWRRVHPYGFLHGHRHYLVAFHVNPKANKITLFRLPNIEAVRLLDDSFVRDETFSLKSFAERSFGVYQEEPVEVKWRFTPQAAAAAEEFLFHPSQKMKRRPDGSLDVKFRAGGLLEMAWHLYCWGDQVEVIEPEALAKLATPARQHWPAFP